MGRLKIFFSLKLPRRGSSEFHFYINTGSIGFAVSHDELKEGRDVKILIPFFHDFLCNYVCVMRLLKHTRNGIRQFGVVHLFSRTYFEDRDWTHVNES